MKIANIKELDIANGDGIRTSIFVSGCRNYCEGCFNQTSWDFEYGQELTEELTQKIIESCSNEIVKGISILGGEPLDERNQEGVLYIIDAFRSKFGTSKDIWLWTGYTLEETIPQTEYTKDILDNIDYLIDGKYIDSLRNLNLKYRGSSNQRVFRNINDKFIEQKVD